MNCEYVFEILTRGPFPTGESSDWQVERHLLACHECRQLAEALRPAVSLFHECIHSEESSELPGYRGRLNSLSSRATNLEHSGDAADATDSWPAPAQPAVVDGTRPARGFGRWCNLNTAGVLAGLVLALVLGWQWNSGPAGSQTAESLSWPSAALLPVPDEQGQLLLARLDLPADCRNASHLPERRLALLAALPPSSARQHSDQKPIAETYLCCTHCHAAHLRQPSTTRMVAATVRSCEACHQPDAKFEVATLPSPL